jgi:hypothetical protein
MMPMFATSPVCLVALVCLVYLVDLVHLVSIVQPKKPDRPEKPNNGLLLLADLFSILLEVESYLRIGVTKMFADPHMLLVLAH